MLGTCTDKNDYDFVTDAKAIEYLQSFNPRKRVNQIKSLKYKRLILKKFIQDQLANLLIFYIKLFALILKND